MISRGGERDVPQQDKRKEMCTFGCSGCSGGWPELINLEGEAIQLGHETSHPIKVDLK